VETGGKLRVGNITQSKEYMRCNPRS